LTLSAILIWKLVLGSIRMMETSVGSPEEAVNLMVLGVEKSHVVLEVGSVTVMARAEEKRARAERANEYCILKIGLVGFQET